MFLFQQSLSPFTDNPGLKEVRKNIEANFESVKDAVTPEKGRDEIKLPSQYAQW